MPDTGLSRYLHIRSTAIANQLYVHREELKKVEASKKR